VSLNYPNSDEGKEALLLLQNLLPRIANKNFLYDEESDRWKVVYSFNSDDLEAAEKLKEKLDDAIEWNRYVDMKTSIDYYVPDTLFVVIHGLNTRLGGRGFAEVLKENKKYKIKDSFFEISSPNYKIIQIHKNLEDYLKLDLSKKVNTKVKQKNKKEKSAEFIKSQQDLSRKAKEKRRRGNSKDGGSKN